MKLDKADNLRLWHYILECGECKEGERIKHDMCYAERFVDVTNELVNDEWREDSEMLAPFVGCRLQIDGYTTYYDGFETDEETISVLVETQETRVVAVWKPATILFGHPERKLLDVTIPAMTSAKEVL